MPSHYGKPHNGNGRKNGSKNGTRTATRRTAPMTRGVRPDTASDRRPMQPRNNISVPVNRAKKNGPFVTHAMHNRMHENGHTTGGNWVIKGTSQRWTGPVVNAGNKWLTGNAVTAHSREVVPGGQQPQGFTRGRRAKR